MSQDVTIRRKVHFTRGQRSEKRVREGRQDRPAVEPGRVPRISRLMALAIRFDQLIQDGTAADYADLARLGHVSRARFTQIMNLLNLAPDIQEEILFLPRTEQGRDLIVERHLRAIAGEMDWGLQRRMWRALCDL